MSTNHYQNFRLQGIPRECQTRASVRELVTKALSIESDVRVFVCSLAISPVEQDRKIATLRFSVLPDCLCDTSKDEWIFDPPADDISDEDVFASPLVFDTHFSGFTPLYNTNDNDCEVDVIAISGLGGHAFGSFKQRNGSFMWLRDALPQDVPSARILIYGYDTHLIQSASFQNLTDLGKALLSDMEGVQNLGQSRPIVFIGHSLGGLVIKEALIKLKESRDEQDASILKSTSGFLFFGVPHQGMAIESLVPLVMDNPNRSLLESLNKNSALLHRLEKEFSDTFNEKRLRIISFYETEKSPTAVENGNGKWELSGPLQVLVDVSSATCGSGHRNPINCNHSEMVKYKNRYDRVYTRVLTVLRSLLKPPSMSTVGNTEFGDNSASLSKEKIIECLRSLSFREENHRYNDIHCAGNSCEWLLKDSQYQAWMNSPRGLFWIKGNPGAGKSVLMKFAVTEMERRKLRETTASFFIHGRGQPLQKTPLGVFRALLHSMLESFPEYLSQLTETFNNRERRHGAYQKNRWEWREQELQDFMFQVLTEGTRNRSIVIFVDALDECGKDYARKLLDYFKNLMDAVEQEKARVKICFSSRHYPILSPEAIPAISVEDRNGADIRRFIRNRLKEILPSAKREKMEKNMLRKARGGFQWTVLMTDIILDGNATGINAENLLKRLTTTPEALDELYAEILGSVAKAEKRQVAKLFLWVLFAERPLRAQELREALAFDKDMDYTSIFQLRYHDSWTDTLPELERYISHLSRGLMAFQKRKLSGKYGFMAGTFDGEVQFVHQSIHDYVLDNFVRHFGSEFASQSIAGAGQFEISRSCLKYLSLKEVLEGSRLSRDSLTEKFPLLPYAMNYVFYHIQKVEQERISQADLLSVTQWSEQPECLEKLAKVWRVIAPYSFFTPKGWPFVGTTPLHILVAFGSKSAFDTLLLKDDVQVDGRDSDENTPLLLAVREDRQEMALELLNRSIEWQRQHGTILLSANDDEEIESYTSYFVNANAENSDGDTVLTVAAMRNARDVIFKLIEAGADLELAGQQAALVSYAIRNRDRNMLLELLQKEVKLGGAVQTDLVLYAIRDKDKDMLWGFCRKVIEQRKLISVIIHCARKIVGYPWNLYRNKRNLMKQRKLLSDYLDYAREILREDEDFSEGS